MIVVPVQIGIQNSAYQSARTLKDPALRDFLVCGRIAGNSRLERGG